MNPNTDRFNTNKSKKDRFLRTIAEMTRIWLKLIQVVAAVLLPERGMQLLSVSAIDIDLLLGSMSLRQKIGQMAQFDIAAFYDSPSQTMDWDRIAAWQQKYEFGSMLNSIFSGGSIGEAVGWNATEWRTFIFKLQTSAQNTTAKIPVIYGIDSIHGGTYIYGSALFPQAINLAATFNRDLGYIQGAVCRISDLLTLINQQR